MSGHFGVITGEVPTSLQGIDSVFDDDVTGGVMTSALC